MFSIAKLSLATGKMRKNYLSHAAFGMILQNHRRLPISIFSVKLAALGSLKRVTGRTFKVSKYIISKEQAKTLRLIFVINSEKIVKTISACTEFLFIIKKNKKYKKYSSRDRIPLIAEVFIQAAVGRTEPAQRGECFAGDA